MPTSFWGFLAYALLAAIAWNNMTSQWKFAWFVTIVGLFYSLYLTGISFFELQAACPYCLTSLGLMLAIFITLLLQKPASLSRFSWGPWLGKMVGAALVIVVALHLHYAGYLGNRLVPKILDPRLGNLTRTDAKFYGASWCPHCTEQKKLFGGSGAAFLCRVRLRARGRGKPRLQRSRDKTYPTLGDQRPALHGYPEPGCPGAVQPVQKRRRQTMKRRSSQPTYFSSSLRAWPVFFSQPTRASRSVEISAISQQSPPANFLLISVDELVDEVKAGKKPMIIDVRTEEEYREVHILERESRLRSRSSMVIRRGFPRIDWSSCIELAPITWPVWPMASSTKKVTAI